MKKSKLVTLLMAFAIMTSTVIGCEKKTEIEEIKKPEIVEDQNEENNKPEEEQEEKEMAIYNVVTYTLTSPDAFPVQLELSYEEVEVEKGNLLELTKATYEVAVANSNGYLKEGSKVTNVEQKDGITYVTLSKEFSKDWTGGSFYESVVFDTMTASLCSIEGIDKVSYKLEGELPSLHTELEGAVFTTEYLEENYEIVEEGKGEVPDVLEIAEYKIATYTLTDPNAFPLELEVVYKEVEVEKGNLLELTKATYEAAVANSNGYLKEGSKVTNVKQKDGITYVTLSKEFSKDWTGGTFYESVVFDTMTASLCSIEGIDKVSYKLEGELPSLHMELESAVFTTDYLEENYTLVTN